MIWAGRIRDICLYYIWLRFSSLHYWEGLESVPKTNCTGSWMVLKTPFMEAGKLPRAPLLWGLRHSAETFQLLVGGLESEGVFPPEIRGIHSELPSWIRRDTSTCVLWAPSGDPGAGAARSSKCPALRAHSHKVRVLTLP